jgi:hypothetical protein
MQRRAEGGGAQIKFAMTAEVNIVTAQKTNVLLAPSPT